MKNSQVFSPEGNKLIVEFLGCKLLKNGKYDLEAHYYLPEDYISSIYETAEYSIENMCYHSHYEWIMPVVEKIESLTVIGKEDIGKNDENIQDVEWTFSVEIKDFQCMIHRNVLPQYHGITEDFLKLWNCDNKSKIEAIYVAVISFIEWYNKQK